MGCLSGIEPEITGPQPAVLPLHHRHHQDAKEAPKNYSFSVSEKSPGSSPQECGQLEQLQPPKPKSASSCAISSSLNS